MASFCTEAVTVIANLKNCISTAYRAIQCSAQRLSSALK